ncbi:hypothetical protein [Micropruina sp.]|uniref:hypothetical protein n=1 Tax=Micropruina sp. TaxID=2737536 RepID=UPI0039E5C38E
MPRLHHGPPQRQGAGRRQPQRGQHERQQGQPQGPRRQADQQQQCAPDELLPHRRGDHPKQRGAGPGRLEKLDQPELFVRSGLVALGQPGHDVGHARESLPQPSLVDLGRAEPFGTVLAGRGPHPSELCGCGKRRCDRAGRGPAQVAEPELAGQFAQGERVDHPAGGTALHRDVDAVPHVLLLRRGERPVAAAAVDGCRRGGVQLRAGGQGVGQQIGVRILQAGLWLALVPEPALGLVQFVAGVVEEVGGLVVVALGEQPRQGVEGCGVTGYGHGSSDAGGSYRIDLGPQKYLRRNP